MQVARGMKIYTKTGDKGSSSLFNGERRQKDSAIFEAVGSFDELSSALGVAKEYCKTSCSELGEDIEIIQSRLLDAGSSVATPSGSAEKLDRVKFPEETVQWLEQRIDRFDKELPLLKNFILPSGGFSASYLHVARGVCRRAERATVHVAQESDVDPAVLRFLNRLSDYLFMAARYAAKLENQEEIIYKKSA